MAIFLLDTSVIVDAINETKSAGEASSSTPCWSNATCLLVARLT